MKYKTILRFFALVLAFTLLGAAFAQDDMVTVVYWDEPQSPGAEVVINQIIENFEAANPGVDVVREVGTRRPSQPYCSYASSSG